jgi:hypothetical protein
LRSSHRHCRLSHREAQRPEHRRTLGRALKGAAQRIERAQLPRAPTRRGTVNGAREAGVDAGAKSSLKMPGSCDLAREQGCGISTASPQGTAGSTGGTSCGGLPLLAVGIERIVPAPGGDSHHLPAGSTTALPSGVKRLGD